MNSLRLAARHLKPTQPIPTCRPIISITKAKAKTANMSTFTIPNSNLHVNSIPDLSQNDLLSFPAFKVWITTLQQSLARQEHPSHEFHSDPYVLRKIDIQAVDRFGGGRLGFIKLKAEVSNAQGETLPGSVFLRGGSVGMLVSYCLFPHDRGFPLLFSRYIQAKKCLLRPSLSPRPSPRPTTKRKKCVLFSNFMNSLSSNRMIYRPQLRRISALS